MQKRLLQSGVLGGLVLLTFALLLLGIAFLQPRLNFYPAWMYTSLQTPWHYRLAGVWFFQEGAMLLLCWLLATLAAFFLFSQRRQFHAKAVISILCWAVAVFSFFLAGAGRFTETPAQGLLTHPAGRGLDAIFLTPWGIIHPLTLFIAYALLFVPFAIHVAQFFHAAGCQGEQSPSPRGIATTWAGWAWLFLTLSLASGIYWAHSTPAWGGFWTWEPLEVPVLALWFALTAYLQLHPGYTLSPNEAEITGKSRLEAETGLALLLPLILLIAGFLGRSGAGVIHPAGESFTAGAYLLLAASYSGMYLAFLYLSVLCKKKGLLAADMQKHSFAGPVVIILTIISVSIMILLIFTLQRRSPELFEARLFPLLLVCLSILTFQGKGRFFALLMGITAGLAGAFLLPLWVGGLGADHALMRLYLVGFLSGWGSWLVVLSLKRLLTAVNEQLSINLNMMRPLPRLLHKLCLAGVVPQLGCIGAILVLMGYGLGTTLYWQGDFTIHPAGETQTFHYLAAFQDYSLHEKQSTGNEADITARLLFTSRQGRQFLLSPALIWSDRDKRYLSGSDQAVDGFWEIHASVDSLTFKDNELQEGQLRVKIYGGMVLLWCGLGLLICTGIIPLAGTVAGVCYSSGKFYDKRYRG